MKREFEKIWVLSTAHLPAEVFGALVDHLPVITRDYEEGTMVYCGTPNLSKVPAELERILREGGVMGCAWISFDRDGPVDELLPKFDW